MFRLAKVSNNHIYRKSVKKLKEKNRFYLDKNDDNFRAD